MTTEPTECDDCGGSLERGYSSIYRGTNTEPTKHVCHTCSRKERWADWGNNRVLTTRLISDAILTRVPTEESKNVMDDLRVVEDEVRDFEEQVWRGGLKKQMTESADRGFSRKKGGLKLMAYYIAGRYLMTIEDDDSSVMVIASDDDDSRMGLQGICAKRDDAVMLLKRGRILWEQTGELETDGGVSVL